MNQEDNKVEVYVCKVCGHIYSANGLNMSNGEACEHFAEKIRD